MSVPFETIEVLDDATADILRQMTPGERLSICDRMWKFASDLLRANVTREHPDWTEDQIQRETARRISDPAFEEWAIKNIRVTNFLDAAKI